MPGWPSWPGFATTPVILTAATWTWTAGRFMSAGPAAGCRLPGPLLRMRLWEALQWPALATGSCQLPGPGPRARGRDRAALTSAAEAGVDASKSGTWRRPPQQYVRGAACPLGDLGGGDSGAEPCRYGGVPEVVRATGDKRRGLAPGKGRCPRRVEHLEIRAVGEQAVQQ